MNTKTYKEWWNSIDDYLAHMLMKEGYNHNKVYNIGITELRAAGEEGEQMTMDEFVEFICRKTGIPYSDRNKIKRNLIKVNSSRQIKSEFEVGTRVYHNDGYNPKGHMYDSFGSVTKIIDDNTVEVKWDSGKTEERDMNTIYKVNSSHQIKSEYHEKDSIADIYTTLTGYNVEKVDIGWYIPELDKHFYSIADIKNWMKENKKSVQSSRKITSSKENVLADLNDMNSEFEVVEYMKEFFNKQGKPELYEKFCDDVDNTDDIAGKVAEKYVQKVFNSKQTESSISHKAIKSDYYDNPDRILIGVDINTHLDLFEDSYSQYTGKQFDWDRDGEDFNKASSELDRIVENNFATKLGHKAVEEFHDGEAYDISVYHCTFWGDRNNQNDIKILQELQGQADDKWTDNGRVEVAIYNGDVYSDGSYFDDFVEKWGDMGAALAESIIVGVDFPEEFDSEPDYDNVNGLHTLKNSRQIKSSADWVNRVPDGINLFLYSKDNQAKDKRYFPVGDDWGQTDRLLYAKMFTKDGMQKALAAIEPQLPEGMSIQVRDAKGKVYYTYPNNINNSRQIKSSAQFVYMSDMKPKNWTKKISNAAIRSNVQNCGYYDYFGKKGLCLKGSYDGIKEFMEKCGRFDPSSIYSNFKWDEAEMLESVKSGAELEGSQKDNFIKKAMKMQGYSDKEANQMINQSKK